MLKPPAAVDYLFALYWVLGQRCVTDILKFIAHELIYSGLVVLSHLWWCLNLCKVIRTQQFTCDYYTYCIYVPYWQSKVKVLGGFSVILKEIRDEQVVSLSLRSTLSGRRTRRTSRFLECRSSSWIASMPSAA